MDYEVTVRTYTGAVKTVEVKEMPNEEAAAAEAVGLTFGRVLDVKLIGGAPEAEKPKPKPKQTIERELKPGETENIITGWNHNPLALFNALNYDGDLF